MFDNIENLQVVSSLHRVSKPYGRVECRKLNTFNIRLQGAVVYDFNGKTITINEGEMIFIPKGTSYEYRTVPGKECICTTINFEGNLTDAAPQSYPLDDFYDLEYMGSHFADLWKFGSPADKYKCISMFYNLISYVSNIENSSYADKRKYYIIDPAASYLKEHIYNCSLRIEKLHTLCGVSNTYFRRIFISRFGTSPRNYIVSKRMSQAKSIIDSGDFNTVREVALSVGYSDPLYFSKVFKKTYGISPSKANK